MSIMELMSHILPVFAISSILIIILTKIYLKLRPRFPINVNCWFCNKWSKVSYDLRNCWDCQFCSQYNGFTSDGDYNKPIPAQHDEFLNKQPIVLSKNQIEAKNGLCDSCNNNQQLKIHQLAMFSPLNENKFDEEIEIYKRQLERAYRLCSQCEKVVKRTLQKQMRTLLGSKLSKLKRGLSLLNVDLSISKTASQKFVDYIRYANVILAIVYLFQILMKYLPDMQQTLPRAAPYFLLINEMLIFIQNTAIMLFEQSSFIYNTFMKTDVFCFVQNELYKAMKLIEFYFPAVNVRNTLLTVIGRILQILLLFISRSKNLDYIKGVAWVLLALFVAEKVNVLNLHHDIVQVTLSTFIIVTSSRSQSKTIKISKNTSNLESTEKSFTNNSDILNSTFKSDSSKLDLSNSTPKLFDVTHNMPSFSSKKLENDVSFIFGQQPVFENPLNTSKYRSWSNESFSGKSNLNNSLMNNSDSFSDDLFTNPKQSKTEDFELYKCLSDLHLGTCLDSRKKDLRSPFKITSDVVRPKPILSPPRLRNVTQSSWIAGGYWKTNDLNFPCTNLSRSSSQSSGFGSQTSGQQTHFDNTVFNSLPSSRNNSICEFDKFSVFSEPAYQYSGKSNGQNRVYPVRYNRPVYPCSSPTNTEINTNYFSRPSSRESNVMINDHMFSTVTKPSFHIPAARQNTSTLSDIFSLSLGSNSANEENNPWREKNMRPLQF